MQVVYNANKLAKLVQKKKKMQNWLVYYRNKVSRSKNSTRPLMKVLKMHTYLGANMIPVFRVTN